jgi:hypothetical protein
MAANAEPGKLDYFAAAQATDGGENNGKEALRESSGKIGKALAKDG